MSSSLLVRAVAAGLAMTGVSWVHAWEKPPIKVDAAFNFRFNVKVGPTHQHKAPWYSYFPYDPSLHPSSGGNPYPNWPSTFPPAEGSSNDKSAQAGRFPNWPGQLAQQPGAQPPAGDAEQDRRTGQVASATPTQSSAATPVWQTSNYPPYSSSSLAWQPMAPGVYMPGYWYGR